MTRCEDAAHEARKRTLDNVRYVSGCKDGDSIVEHVANMKAQRVRAEEKQAEAERKAKRQVAKTEMAENARDQKQTLIDLWSKDFWQIANKFGVPTGTASQEFILGEIEKLQAEAKDLNRQLSIKKDAYDGMVSCADYWFKEECKAQEKIKELRDEIATLTSEAEGMVTKEDLDTVVGALTDAVDYWQLQAEGARAQVASFEEVVNVADAPRALWMDSKQASEYATVKDGESRILFCEAEDCYSDRGRGLKKFQHYNWESYLKHPSSLCRPQPAILCEHCMKRLALDDAGLLPES